MKTLRVVPFVIFAICAFCFPAESQKKWTYHADNGTTGFGREEITITITQQGKFLVVTGEFVDAENGGTRSHCPIHGEYFPQNGSFRAWAQCPESNGRKPPEIAIRGIKAGNDLQVKEPWASVARLEGAKPPAKKNEPSSSSADAPSVVGSWTWAFAKTGEPQEHGSVTFNADGTMSWSGGSHGKWTQSGSTVTLKWEDKSYTDTMTLSKDGKTMEGTNDDKWKVKGTRK